MIDMVDYEMVGRADYFTVYPDIGSLCCGAGATDGIKSVILPILS
jgi:hypothetical protein